MEFLLSEGVVRRGLETATSGTYRAEHEDEFEQIVSWRLADSPSEASYYEQARAGAGFDLSRDVGHITSPDARDPRRRGPLRARRQRGGPRRGHPRCQAEGPRPRGPPRLYRAVRRRKQGGRHLPQAPRGKQWARRPRTAGGLADQGHGPWISGLPRSLGRGVRESCGTASSEVARRPSLGCRQNG